MPGGMLYLGIPQFRLPREIIKMEVDNILAMGVTLHTRVTIGVPQTHGFDLLAWILPFAGIGIGAAALGGGAWYWSRNRPGDEASFATTRPPLDPELDRRVDEELARFDD